ncbi:hypothetical protein W1240910_173 [Cyanophage S-RIM12_W1_24_0910]|uniref:Uncharacterized protein n=2 Tax=Brizovirus TaxID=2733098 RepID=A0A1D7SWX4_9CAUD|nr:hypothetical protein HOQ64_gp061 [Cyanophage S-RIM12 isolate RW_01_0310]AOO15873.1 hypothetical protein RW010310_172 [Cyanophage S-RIM12 isolate RW_01_0310]AOO18236.1 hypothetical protein Sn070910_171 [Cyanophage S-RIM12_Sn_07_0910]AOO19093.1 hypothetical protein W1240910_173 [Cyanophage S-RIM12_W1_24_0910]
MLSFKALSERKTKVKINPRQSEITEKECGCDDKKKKKCPKCEGKGCKHCGGTGYHDEDGDGADMSEAKKKDDSYLEVNFKKRQKNNEKARKEMDKVPGQKNPHFESKENSAYVSQEEVSEESTEEVAETETLLTFKQYVSEEGADSLKDRRMERGGVGGNQRYNKPISNTPNTFGKKKPKYDGMSALDKVKASIEKQYGKGAIMDTKKKK